MIALAIRSGIAPSAWLAEPPGYIETALELLVEDGPPERDNGPQMSG